LEFKRRGSWSPFLEMGVRALDILLMVINWFVLLLMGFADRFVVGGLGEAWLEMCGGGGTEIGVGRWAKMRVDLDLGFGDSRI